MAEKTSRKVSVPCGWCAECITAKSTAWAIRLKEEERVCRNAYFVTLTYSDEMLPMFKPETGEFNRGKIQGYYPILFKADLQNYIKRVRKSQFRKDFKYYAVGEYGSQTYRPHYHLIIFNTNINKALEKWRINGEIIGNSDVGDVTPASIRYVTNYVLNKKKYNSRKMFPEFSIMSKGLGEAYITRMKQYHLETFNDKYHVKEGKSVILPRYYKERIFNDIDRQLLAEKNKIESKFRMMERTAKDIIETHKVKEIKLSQSKKSRKN